MEIKAKLDDFYHFRAEFNSVIGDLGNWLMLSTPEEGNLPEKEEITPLSDGMIRREREAGPLSQLGFSLRLNAWIPELSESKLVHQYDAYGLYLRVKLEEFGRAHLIMRCNHPVLEPYFQGFWQKYQVDWPNNVEGVGERQDAPPLLEDDPEPLLPLRATDEQWFAWFDWYYRQSWGPVTSRIEHIAGKLTKTKSAIGKKHALYMTNMRS